MSSFFVLECVVSKLDLWFLIDGSGSINKINFETCLEFVNQTASLFVIDSDRVRTGLMIYDGRTYLRSRFDQHQSNQNFSDIVLATTYPSGESFSFLLCTTYYYF